MWIISKSLVFYLFIKIKHQCWNSWNALRYERTITKKLQMFHLSTQFSLSSEGKWNIRKYVCMCYRTRCWEKKRWVLAQHSDRGWNRANPPSETLSIIDGLNRADCVFMRGRTAWKFNNWIRRRRLWRR